MPQQDGKQPQQPNREGRSYDKGAQPFTQDKNVKGRSNRDLGDISEKQPGMDQDVDEESQIGRRDSSNR